MNLYRNVKSKKEREVDELKATALRLEEQVSARQKKILSRVFIRDSSLAVMQAEKAALEKDDRELTKLKRKIERLEDNLK